MPARPMFQVRLFGLDELQKLEAGLGRGRRRFVSRVAEEIAGELAAVSPDDGAHRLASSWEGKAIGENLAVIESDHPAAKARDRGAYIVPKNGRAIRFRNSFGDLVFARFVRQKGTHYVQRGLSKRRVIAEAVFEQELGQLRGGDS